MYTTSNQHHLHHILALVIILLLSCGNDKIEQRNQCECPLKIPASNLSGTTSNNTTVTKSVGGSVEVNIPLIKKMVEANLTGSGKIDKKNISVEETYWEILDGNPEITQNAYLFWTIACAKYDISCEDNTIGRGEKNIYFQEIIQEYSLKIETITDKKHIEVKHFDEGDKVINVPKQKHTFIDLKVITDAVFSNAIFFVDDIEVYPLSSSTLTVKKFSIPFKQKNITFKAISKKEKCIQSISISDSYHSNPKIIQIICSS
jgi:hypothetical protein